MHRGITGLVSSCVVAGALAYGANAEAAMSCNGCSAAQAETYAASLGRGDHYIYDLPGNHLYLYTTECEPIVGGQTCYAYPDTPAAANVSSFNSYRLAWVQNGYSEAFEGSVSYGMHSANDPNGRASDDGYVNAYDTVYFSTYQNALTAYLADVSHYSGTLATVMSTVNNISGQFNDTAIVITVTFHDGSKRSFKWDLPNHRFIPVPDSAKDADNNTLPERGHNTPPQGYGFNDSSSGHHYDPGNVAVLLGVAPPDIHETYYQCQWVPSGEGGSLNCTAH